MIVMFIKSRLTITCSPCYNSHMPDSQQMQCMEVWGGSQLTERGVEMGGLDAWVYSKPFGQSDGGGDIYYASSCATGRINRLLLADVAGHGNTVAEIAISLRTLMRRYVNYLDQRKMVRSMNQQFAAMSQNGCFATALVTTFFSPTRRLSICNAGHPRPLHYRAAEKEWSILEQHIDHSGGNIPLGILDLAEYEQFDVDLNVGDLVVCYTDALTESRGEDGEMFGETGLLQIARNLSIDDPKQFIDALLAEIARRHPGNLSADDTTILLLRPNGRRPRYTLMEKLGAQIRFLGILVKSINPRAQRPPLPDLNLANIGGAVIPCLGKYQRSTPCMGKSSSAGETRTPAQS
jgi:phosphoserine phosphatase RsbU/P